MWRSHALLEQLELELQHRCVTFRTQSLAEKSHSEDHKNTHRDHGTFVRLTLLSAVVSSAETNMFLIQSRLVVFCFLYCCRSLARGKDSDTTADTKPNIVFILSDDQDVFLGGLVSKIMSLY